MPGTGMSLAKFLSLTLWIVLVIYILALLLGMAAQRWPNALTLAMYRVVSGK